MATIMITGGTGSFGNAMVGRLLADEQFSRIRIFSRDEKKQWDMRNKYNNPRLEFFIGDVRVKSSLIQALNGIDYLFHAAALKQVPTCEFFPDEAFRTNVIGAQNILEIFAEGKCSVSKAVFLSTDKAVYPINSMGMTKALMEKLVLAHGSRELSDTAVMVTRYGNVLSSRGSVIPRFLELISAGQELTVTSPDMTRFLMTLEEAVDLVLFAFRDGGSGDLFVKKSPAAQISTICEAVSKIVEKEVKTRLIGVRHGEKMHETLVSTEEMSRSVNLGDYYKVMSDTRGMDYDNYFTKGNQKDAPASFNSENADRLNAEAVEALIREALNTEISNAK